MYVYIGVRPVVALFWRCFDAHLVFIRGSGVGVVPFNAINGTYLAGDEPADVSRFVCGEATRIVVTQSGTIHRYSVRGTPKKGIYTRFPLAALWLFVGTLDKTVQHFRISDLGLRIDG
jgi:hypothetical protein